jgi:hypothetical protein
MKRIQLCLLLVGVMGYTPIAIAAAASAQSNQPKGVKPGVIGAVALNREGTYCHLRFPAIRPSTLTSAKPQLKPATAKDIIDYYDPCDHDQWARRKSRTKKRWRQNVRTNDYQ